MDTKCMLADALVQVQGTYPHVDADVQMDYAMQIVSARISGVESKTVGWASTVFRPHVDEEREQDDYFEDPMASRMHDSVVACSKCGSSKTFNIEKQTRSLDEPSTVITICYECKHRSRYSG